MNIRRILIIIACGMILLICIVISSISYRMGVNYGEQNAEIIRETRLNDTLSHHKIIKSVKVQIITNTDIQPRIKSSGRVISSSKISISSEVSGKLYGDFSIKKGEKFRKGDILFRIKSDEVQHLVDARKSTFMNLISTNLADIKLDFPSEYKKWDKFFNSISLSTPISEIPETNSSREKNFIISKGIISAYLSLKSEEERLKKYTVIATYDGVISKSYVDIGTNINIGSPIIDIIRTDKMEIELTVNKSEIKFIKTGNTVSFSDGEKTISGEIMRKSNFVNRNTQNISVFASIDSEIIYDGTYLEATIFANAEDNICKIPRRAIFSKNNIYIVNKNNQLEILEINIISKQENHVLVDNIIDSTIVVIEPLIDIKEGTIINPIIE